MSDWPGVSLLRTLNLSDVLDVDTARGNLRVPGLRHCQCAATTNRALSGALPTIDGYAVQDGDRVLLTAQTTRSQNGPWVAHAAGWVRPHDYPSGASLTSRMVAVSGGQTLVGALWVMASTSASVTIDTDATTWVCTEDRVLLPSGGDDTARINLAVAAGIKLAPGLFQISGPIDCPLGSGADRRAGQAATTIRCTDPAAQILIGAAPGGPPPQIHSTRGNFIIDGRVPGDNSDGPSVGVGGAGSALFICNSEGTTFLPIDVNYSAGDGVWWLGQNCTFITPAVARAHGDGWVQDQGSGGVAVLNYEFSGNYGKQMRSKQTAAWAAASAYTVPTNNKYYVGRLESSVGTGCYQNDAGQFTMFDHPEFSSSVPPPDALALVRVSSNAEGNPSGSVIIKDAMFNGPGSEFNTAAILTDIGFVNELRGVILQGENQVGGCAAVWRTLNTEGISYDEGNVINFTGGYASEGSPGALVRRKDGQGYRRAVRSDYPASWFKFGETLGTAVKDEQGIATGAYHGAFALGKPGAIKGDVDSAVLLSGGYATAPSTGDLQLTTSFTVEAWVNMSSNATDQVVVSKFASGWQWFVHTDGKQKFQCAGFTTASTSAVPLNQWSHLVITYDGTTFSFYLNGVLDGTSAVSGSVGANTTPVGLGARDDGSFPLAGLLDEIAIYRQVLSADRVAIHYRAAGY